MWELATPKAVFQTAYFVSSPQCCCFQPWKCRLALHRTKQTRFAFAVENPNSVLSNPLHAIEEMQDVAPTDNSSDDGRENEEEFKALMKQTMHSDEWQEIKDENYGEFYFFNARLKV